MFKTTLKVAVFVVLILFPVYAFSADQKLMSLEEVEKIIDSSPNGSVDAYFESVERGTKITKYDITLQGILRQPGLKVIMFTTRHKIVAGMSGSPVYLKGRKIGALAYNYGSFSFSNPSWGGISPISLMVQEVESANQYLNSAKAFSYKDMVFEPISFGTKSIKGLENVAGGKFVLMNRSIANSEDKNLIMATPILKAGMPIVVDLAEWTDEKGETSTISAMGTITHIGDNGEVYAFGHPFLDAKNVVYSFRTARVMGTVLSEFGSFKLTGKTSDVLGAITSDSSYGIYGAVKSGELKRLHHFNLEFKKEGKTFHKFDIKVADSVMAAIIAQAVFSEIGRSYGAPLAQESSVTQIETRTELVGYEPVIWKGLFASFAAKFGAATIRASSYDVASENFFTNVYGDLADNTYDLNISDVFVSVNFIPGKSRVYKLGAYKFPNKVIYGQNPILDVMFVDENNLMPIAKKAVVNIDWSQIEKPVYTRDTLDTDKVSEKVVHGLLRMNGPEFYVNNITSSEKQKVLPQYFLNPKDFLESLTRRFEVNNQKVFIRVGIEARSGLLDKAIATAKDIMPAGISPDESGWYVIKNGLKERQLTIRNEGVVVFAVDIPDFPDGYVLESNFQETFSFEVVLDK